jgi:alpha-galactosidase
MFDMPMRQLNLSVVGLNHFAFVRGLIDKSSNKDLMPKFTKDALGYFKEHEQRFEFSTLTFEVFKRFGYFCYAGDNHLGEYIQFGEEFTKTQDMIDWIDFIEKNGQAIYKRFIRKYKRLKENKYPKKGILFSGPSGERAIPIIEGMIEDKDSYEIAVNIPNNGIVENLPQDIILECSATVDKDGVHGIKLGNLPKNIAAILRIEASVQDLCVEAVLQGSKELAIASLAIDPNVGSFEMAEDMLSEMIKLQKGLLPKFK